jgi:hypothetical protein
MLRDGILSSERIARLSWADECFYRRLMSVVDDYGRFYAHPALLRAACYPLLLDKVSDSDVGKWLTACVDAALVRVYPALDGKRYLEVQDFGQRIQSKSKFPDPVGSASTEDHGGPPCPTVDHGESPESTALVVDEVEVDKRRPADADPLFEGVNPEIVKDFKRLRKAKQAPISETAMAGIKREAAKAGYTLEQALATCCERGWTGFKADWVTGARTETGAQPTKLPRLQA